jgi:hypothetical protein
LLKLQNFLQIRLFHSDILARYSLNPNS